MDKCQACHPEFIEGLSKPYNHHSSRPRQDQGVNVILLFNWYNRTDKKKESRPAFELFKILRKPVYKKASQYYRDAFLKLVIVIYY